METIATYPDLISAQLAQSLLDAEGIASEIPEEHIAGLDWRWSTALQGIRLQVDDEDAERAAALLTDNSGVEPGETEETVPAAAQTEERCAVCGSDLMGPGRWRRRAKVLTMIVPILIVLWPLLLWLSPEYECLRCGRLWRQERG
jgi:hypothetical protein